jgi:oligopeptide/dipeptide ABC transporter ATP-binding protein
MTTLTHPSPPTQTGRALDVADLRVSIGPRGRQRSIITGVDLHLAAGEALGLVGESGSGKSVTSRAILRMLGPHAEVSGTVRMGGRDVYAMNRRELRAWHASEVALINQDPRASINALHPIGDFLTETLRTVSGVSRRDADQRAVALLKRVGIGNAELRMGQYPHELSGGLLQRVMIASALLARPKLLIADEPTTALDVTTQEDVVGLLDELRHEEQLALIFITHDLDLAAAVTDRIAVMYAGRIVETAPTAALTGAPRHPYTSGLLASRPSPTARRALTPIPGRPIAAHEAGTGCVFASRCVHVVDLCRETTPVLAPLGVHTVACHRAAELDGRLSGEETS